MNCADINEILDMYAYIVKNSFNNNLLFNDSPYQVHLIYPAILGLYIYSNIDTLSARIIKLPDTNLSKLWCEHYNYEYQSDVAYDNYKASCYAYKYIYQLSYDQELDIYIDSYTNKLRIEPFNKIIYADKLTKVCSSVHGLCLYKADIDKACPNVSCNLNIIDICKIAIYKKNKELLTFLSDKLNAPRRRTLLATIQSSFDGTDDYELKNSMFDIHAEIQNQSYDPKELLTALMLDLSFEKTIAILELQKSMIDTERKKLPVF